MLSLITDRTTADVLEIKRIKTKLSASGWTGLTLEEQATWLYTKGEYRHTDLNRVGQAVLFLAGELAAFGYPVTVNPKTDWTVNDKPTPAQRTVYLTDVAAVKERFYGTTTIPAAMDCMDQDDANNIELLLLEIERKINNMVAAFVHSGTAICGQGALL